MSQVVTDPKRIQEFLDRGTVEIIERPDLEKELLSGRPLRAYIGYDVTGPNLHLGHGATLMKLRDLQELGHQVIVVIGDFTAKVGDHSGLLEKRKRLTDEEIATSRSLFIAQFAKILDMEKVEVHYNSEWLAKLGFDDVIDLARLFTVQQMIERESFAQRLADQNPIGLEELLYPLMQGYDAYALKTDIQLGGTDQIFNLVAGRKIMEALGMKPQNIITTPLIPGTDGRKMSKSWGNYIAMSAAANDIYGGVMSAIDDVIIDYFKLLTRIPMSEIEKMSQAIAKRKTNPMELKKKLAFEVTKIYYDETAAQEAENYFETVHQKGALPEEIEEFTVTSEARMAAQLIFDAGLAASKSAAKRLIEQGGVEIDDQKITDPNQTITPADGMTIRAGKRRFARLRVA